MICLPLTALALFCAVTFFSTKASACDRCDIRAGNTSNDEWTTPGVGAGAGTWPRLRTHMNTERTAMESWIIQIFWEDNVLPAMMLMTEQISNVMMKQAEIIGAFMDAKHQLETQQVFQKIAARGHKDYMPSTGMCEFGTSARSLAATERKGELTALVLAKRSQNRNLGNMNTAAGEGEGVDKTSRIKQFREKFCDPRDNNNGLRFLCDHNANYNDGTIGTVVPNGIGAPTTRSPAPPALPAGVPPRLVPDVRKNKDIDYTRTVDFPWTMDVDFVTTAADPDVPSIVPNQTLTEDEEDLMALASNLYGNELFYRPIPGGALRPDNAVMIRTMQQNYLDARAIIAKRSVAENSFNAIAAMKSAGTPGSRDYLSAILEQFLPTPPPAGAPAPPASDMRQRWLTDLKRMLGRNPSYYAQMEILTKKLFQNPDFYTNLYDTPANVDRKGVAIQAIGLMQKFDLYKSYLRNEASLSVLLELAVQELQSEVESEIGKMGAGSQGSTPERE